MVFLDRLRAAAK